MHKQPEQYMISPDFNRSALNAPGMTHDQYRAAVRGREKEILAAMRAPVRAIVEKHAGSVVLDGADYGVDGAARQFSCYMIVQAPLAALDELRAVPDTRLERFANSTFKLPTTF